MSLVLVLKQIIHCIVNACVYIGSNYQYLWTRFGQVNPKFKALFNICIIFQVQRCTYLTNPASVT